MADTNEIKEISNEGIQFLIQEEGLIKRPYLDQVGVPTIGIGCTYYENGTKVKMTDPAITTERAIALFRNLLKNYELAVYSSTRDDINQNQFDALTSFTFNVGINGFKSSDLLKKVNQDKQDPKIKLAFEAWKNAGGKPILLARRKREAALYFAPDNSQRATDQQLYINQVKFIQTKLGLPADGIFGKNTKAAIIDFQKRHNLIADGIAGSQTLAEINKI
ncbi:glycoside hydrolase family protein [Pedobacter sp. PAMC26386]|nr:glycoside hydrolase family protein [Pedobacter sp. PAMC26386]